jgi:SSS family solute:Na+ symporter
MRAPGALALLIMLACTAGMVGYGLLVSRRQRNLDDYFLASRASGWLSIGLALYASNISSTAIIALAGAAYAYGISVYDYEWSATVMLVFFCVFMLPTLLSSRVYTMPEFLELRYDRGARLYFSVLTLFLLVFVDSAAALYCGSLVCHLFAPSVPLWALGALLAGAACLYTLTGGLRAAMWTGSVQAVLLLGSALIIAVAAFARVGGWHALTSRVNPGMLALIRPADAAGVPWPGLLFGIPVLGFYYWCTNHYIVQRVLSARSLEDGRRGALLTGLLKLTGLFLMVLPGTCAILLYPHLSNPDQVYPRLMFGLLPTGLLGLAAAGFVAATLAALAAALNCASALITVDLIGAVAPRASATQLVRIGRLSTLGVLAVAVLWAPQIERFGDLWQYLQAVLAYAVPPIVALFAAGMFWRGANAAGARATLWIGTLCGLVLFLLTTVLHVVQLQFLYAAPILLAIDLAVLIAASLRSSAAPSAAVDALLWHGAHERAQNGRLRGLGLTASYRAQALALLILTALVVVAFR